MFITSKRRGYDRSGQQVASGLFLILMQPHYSSTKYTGKEQFRALVRFVSMSQFGQFMMGNARVGKHKLTLSGSYGGDGMPDMVPDEVFEHGIEIPQELRDAWSNGGGWNGAGSEAIAMRDWALANLKRLRA